MFLGQTLLSATTPLSFLDTCKRAVTLCDRSWLDPDMDG